MMVDGKLSSITIRNDDYKKKNKELRSGRNLVVREKMNWINSVEKYFNKYKKKKKIEWSNKNYNWNTIESISDTWFLLF